ncbi:MAG: type II toxin-antitoxin system YafQ family toxin [Deltaproteobacteria bacterium]|nr:type II toxin-antitoxin system YafQ family toxin [Deltaproteobacteria bacterium]
MKKVSQTTQFSRDVKRMRKRGKDLKKLQEVVKLLVEGIPLPPHHTDHPLTGSIPLPFVDINQQRGNFLYGLIDGRG